MYRALFHTLTPQHNPSLQPNHVFASPPHHPSQHPARADIPPTTTAADPSPPRAVQRAAPRTIRTSSFPSSEPPTPRPVGSGPSRTSHMRGRACYSNYPTHEPRRHGPFLVRAQKKPSKKATAQKPSFISCPLSRQARAAQRLANRETRAVCFAGGKSLREKAKVMSVGV